jgi:hypothetical protein
MFIKKAISEAEVSQSLSWLNQLNNNAYTMLNIEELYLIALTIDDFLGANTLEEVCIHPKLKKVK